MQECEEKLEETIKELRNTEICLSKCHKRIEAYANTTTGLRIELATANAALEALKQENERIKQAVIDAVELIKYHVPENHPDYDMALEALKMVDGGATNEMD